MCDFYLSSNLHGSVQTDQSKILFSPENNEENEIINIYPDVCFQTFEGFGGAITDSSGYVFSLMNSIQKEQLLHQYFSAGEMNYQFVRIPIDSCDFSVDMYEAMSDPDDTELKSFSFARTEKYILPMLKAAQQTALQPLKLMLTPWTPPAFMKTNHDRCHGGCLKPEYRSLWAKYICRYITEFRMRGWQVNRISIQNEPHAVQKWESCLFSAEEEKTFLRDFLYPELLKQNLADIEIYIWDHNKERAYERAKAVIDSRTDEMISGIALHWYSGDHFESLDLLQKDFPDKKLIISESCLEYYKFGANLSDNSTQNLAHDLAGNMNHGLNAFYDWNLLLDQHGGPNHAGNYCDAPMLYDTSSKQMNKRPSMVYYWHFSHFIHPGAVRIAFSRFTDDIDVTAWKNPDKSIAIVLLNRNGVSTACNIRIHEKITKLTLPPYAIGTLVLRSGGSDCSPELL